MLTSNYKTLKNLTLLLSSFYLSACSVQPLVANPQPQQQITKETSVATPTLQVMPTTGAINYTYIISGDGLAAPLQAFDDGAFLFLQLKPGQMPPLPYTNDGQLVDYEMRNQIMVLPKLNSVSLRYGQRRAYVEHKSVEIVRFPSSPQLTATSQTNGLASTSFEVSKPPAPPPPPPIIQPVVKPNQTKEVFVLPIDVTITQLIAKTGLKKGEKVKICYNRVIKAHQAASFMKKEIERMIDGSLIILDPSCTSDQFQVSFISQE